MLTRLCFNLIDKNYTMELEDYNTKMQYALMQIGDEVRRAKRLYSNNFINQHEAYAVILEEVDELWEEIKKNQKNYDIDKQRTEAKQAAAMLVRLMVELL